MSNQVEDKPVAKQAKRGAIAPQSSRGVMPFEEMDRMFDRMFEDFMPRRWMRPFNYQWPASTELAAFEGRMPSVDIIDQENEIVLKAELPGVDKKDLDISMSDSSVTIKATTYEDDKEEKGDYYRSEIAQGSYVRTIPLPVEVDGNKCKAKFKNGVLELVIPKIEQAKRRKISVD